MKTYEKLGAFYLGKTNDLTAPEGKQELLLYDSKDLNTHAVIVGMTGSGKTGLGIALLEEALIDNIPIIAIDPKGDLPNLLLQFPELQPQDFRPWINEQDALNAGQSPDQYARSQAQLWRKGLADWDQEPERIDRLKAAAAFTVYTPGSNAGVPVSVLRDFAPPSADVLADKDLLRERIQTTTTGLLALLGLDVDPITSREHILIANIFEWTWAAGNHLDLAGLIRAIQKPPFERIGIMDLATFYPDQDRFQLAMRLNNLLAAPGFEIWMEGEPLDVGKLLYTHAGKPRASIFTISQLSDAERMFFVTMLLNEMLAWMRVQPGTSSLRAVLYMDEIFGYFPPVKNPPSKAPLLTLLKQARAYGLGVVLSTQNPVDLDYKGLANTGTWFIGRLQTERDKERLLAGLEGTASGSGFNRQQVERTISGLGKRNFLLNNIHDNSPATFETRWVLSYLSGPMTREQIKRLTAAEASPPPAEARPTLKQAVIAEGTQTVKSRSDEPQAPPAMPLGIETFYLPASGAGTGVIYYPAVAAWLEVHYSSRQYKVDRSMPLALAAMLEDGPVAMDWDQSEPLAVTPRDLETNPISGAAFADLPGAAGKAGAYRKWNKDLLRWVRQKQPLTLYRSPSIELTSNVNESKQEFLGRIHQAAREKRDLAVAKLRRKYSSKYNTLNNRLMRAEQAIRREQEQAKAKKIDTVIGFGSAILGAFLGRKAVSATSAYRVSTAMKSAGRIQKERMDIERARETAESVKTQIEQLDAQLQADIDQLEAAIEDVGQEIEEVLIKAKSTDITQEVFALAWMPFRRDAQGRLSPDWQ